MIAELEAVAIRAVQHAGSAHARWRGRSIPAHAKGSAMDVVTDVDREAERELVRVIRAARPLDSIRAEEGTCIEGSSGLSWVLDPLDGTVLNFILNASSKGSENVLMDLPDKHPGYTHMALAVTDLGAVQVALESQDIRITEGPVEFPGARALFVRDPDGNVIEFNQSVPEA